MSLFQKFEEGRNHDYYNMRRYVMNINMSGMAKGNSSVNINVHPNIHGTQPTVTVNGSQSANAALTILRSLTNGETFSANITDVNGSAVTITLDGGQSFTANLLNNTTYNIGDRASFIIQDNSGDSIVLKAAVMKETAFETAMINRSLDAAGLAPTIKNREMVLELMHNGMPIGKDALLDMAKELSLHPGTEIRDIVALKRMGVEVTDSDLKACQNYKEYNGAMQADIDNIVKEMTDSVKVPKNLGDVVRILLAGTDAAQGDAAAGETLKAQAGADEPNADNGYNKNNVSGENPTADSAARSYNSGTAGGTSALGAGAFLQDGWSGGEIKELADNVVKSLETMVENNNAATGKNAENAFKLPDKLLNASNLQNFMAQLADVFDKLESEPLLKKKLGGLVKGDKVTRLLSELARDTFGMKPSDVKDEEAVKEHLARTLTKLNSLNGYAASSQNTALGNAAAAMSSNMEFLNNMNQFMAAVQIPLRHIGEHGEGELYVYSRKHAKQEDDTVKAFLHLDMEHLGALDIYVTLKGSNVTTNFKVEDAYVLDFLESNMGMLTKRLNDDGYNVAVNVSEGDDGEGFDFVKEVLAPELPVSEVKRFKFDVKA